MKRKISIFFILWADIILLVHMALPYHHCHHQTDALIHSPIAASCRAGEWQLHGASHDDFLTHKHDDCGKECVVTESIKLFVLTKEKLFQNSFDEDSELDDFIRIPFVSICLPPAVKQPSLQEGMPSLSYPPFIERIHLLYQSRSLGLRSPPIC